MTYLNQDLAALDAALYMGSTHGPWHAAKPEPHGTGVLGPAQVSMAWCGCATTVGEEGCYSIGFAEAAANAHFIAACSPDRIRRLLDYIRALLDERDALEAENERLRAEVERLRTDGASAVRWAPGSAYWSDVLKELFGPNARDGISVVETRWRKEHERAERLSEALREVADDLDDARMVVAQARAALAIGPTPGPFVAKIGTERPAGGVDRRGQVGKMSIPAEEPPPHHEHHLPRLLLDR